MAGRKKAPVHPGEILMEEFLEPMGISHYRLSKDIRVPPRRINEIIHGKRAITPDTALRLSRCFRMRFKITKASPHHPGFSVFDGFLSCFGNSY